MIGPLPPAESLSERGASLVLVAASLLFMMGFAALAIDIGGAMNERRQDQSAADVGALAAAQFAQPEPGCNSATCEDQAMVNGANEAIAVANATLDDPSAADWSDASACATPPAGFTVSPVSNCVAFNENLQRAWVRIPTIDHATFFGRVFGIDTIALSADAIANTSFGNPGGVLPFLLPSSSANVGCLKTGPNPDWGPCADLPSNGNFGAMDFRTYGNPEMNSQEACNGNPNRLFTANIARGVDHPLGIHPSGSGGGIEEPSACPVFSAQPNMAYSISGNLTYQDIEDGFLYGASYYSTAGHYPGRIEGSFTVRNAQGAAVPAADIDNTPPWDYLRSDAGGDCAGVDTPAEMESCIAWAKAEQEVVFRDDIIDSARFGFTPEVYETAFHDPSDPYYIKGYKPVYIDALFFSCNNDDCSAVHTVGVDNESPCPAPPHRTTCGIPTNGNNKLDGVSAYILHPDILPLIAKTPAPGADDQRRHNLSE